MKVLYIFGSPRLKQLNRYLAGTGPATSFWGMLHLKTVEAIPFYAEEYIRWYKLFLKWTALFVNDFFLYWPAILHIAKCDIVFSTNNIWFVTLTGLLGKKTVWLNFNLLRAIENARGLKKRILLWMVGRLDAIVCLTMVEQQAFRSLGLTRTYYVGLGVDAEFIHPSKSTCGDYVLAIGYDYGRDYRPFFSAMAGLDIPAEVFCSPANVAGLAWSHNVQVKYSQGNEPWGHYYFHARFVVVPLRGNYGSDCPGLTCILEAMAAGKAVIATDLPTTRNYVSDGWNGLLVPEGDAVALRSAISSLWKDPVLASRMGSRGRDGIEAGGGLPEFARRLESVFKQVCSPLPEPSSNRLRQQAKSC